MSEGLSPGASMHFASVERSREHLDLVRLECLKLAAADPEVTMNRLCVINRATELFTFVTEDRPKLYAVKRMDEAAPGDYLALGSLCYLGFNGSALRWDHECSAYRFRSKREAEIAIAKYQDALGGVMLPVPLPSYLDLF